MNKREDGVEWEPGTNNLGTASKLGIETKTDLLIPTSLDGWFSTVCVCVCVILLLAGSTLNGLCREWMFLRDTIIDSFSVLRAGREGRVPHAKVILGLWFYSHIIFCTDIFPSLPSPPACMTILYTTYSYSLCIPHPNHPQIGMYTPTVN